MQTRAAAAVAAAQTALQPGPRSAGSQCCTAQQQRQALAFTRCIAGSPLLLSALLSLELAGTHPPAEVATGGGADPGTPAAKQAAAAASRQGLEATLAQMLALHLRSGCCEGEPPLVPACLRMQPAIVQRGGCRPELCRRRLTSVPRCHRYPRSSAASEQSLLAALWVLEAAHDAWRSPASVCLSSYAKHLQTFSPQVQRMRAARGQRFAAVHCLAALPFPAAPQLGSVAAPPLPSPALCSWCWISPPTGRPHSSACGRRWWRRRCVAAWPAPEAPAKTQRRACSAPTSAHLACRDQPTSPLLPACRASCWAGWAGGCGWTCWQVRGERAMGWAEARKRCVRVLLGAVPDPPHTPSPHPCATRRCDALPPPPVWHPEAGGASIA